MVQKEHLVELIVNGVKLELESQNLGVRMNATLFDASRLSTTQAEYSFSFDIPSTPLNDTVFDYANNLSKANKFRTRYDAELIADGTIIFRGTLIINSYLDKMYNVNLVSIKVYSLDDIFGERKLGDLKWYIDFDGIPAINIYNRTQSKEVTFPLVSYGVFQKDPYNSDDVANDYTSKYYLDQWNRWWVESFYPSHNLVELVKRCFESVGYTVSGDFFTDPTLKEIFLSTNLADDQIPTYNLGRDVFGVVDMDITLKTDELGNGYQQELDFPYYAVYCKGDQYNGFNVQTEYNFNSVHLYDALAYGDVRVNGKTYMYEPKESIIVIPADGFYKVDMSVDTTLNTRTGFTATQYSRDEAGNDFREESMTINPHLTGTTPIEIQLVRNYSDDLELIKGKYNVEYINGNPNDLVAWNKYNNVNQWYTCFPHEDPYNAQRPTKSNDLNFRNTTSILGGERSSSQTTTSTGGGTSQSGNFGGQRTSTRTRGGTIDRDEDRKYTSNNYGYVNNTNTIMAFDPAVSENFICGFSSMGEGTASVIKNGYSWTKSNATLNEAFYPQEGYSHIYSEEGTGYLAEEQTKFNANQWVNCPAWGNVVRTNTTFRSSLSCMVYLKKNDILNLFVVQRHYENNAGTPVHYGTTSNIDLHIEAASPRQYYQLKKDKYQYYSPSEFDYDLNLGEFLNKEKTMSSFIQDVINAFNLDVTQYGKNIDISTHKRFDKTNISAVDIDDRTNSDYEAKSERIDYPRSMAVKYKIDTDEWGFERSAVDNAGGSESVLNDPGWEKYGNSGYTVIDLSDDSYQTTKNEQQLDFSYTWYSKFNWFPVDQNDNDLGGNATILNIPVISKYSYMIDGYSYDESMKYDGYSLTQRMWFRPEETNAYVWTDTYPAEQAIIYTPSNDNGEINLSYRDDEKSLLTRYFNINAYLSSNYVEVECYITADEYNRLRNGAMVHFDSDLYYIVEIEGYDPAGYSKTTLKLLKKVNY